MPKLVKNMNIEPKPVIEGKDIEIIKACCMFCGHTLDFMISESYGVGLNFRCNSCKKNFYITEL